MSQTNKWIVGAIIIAAIIVSGYLVYKGPSQLASNEPIKIGIITPLTGNSAYWGESTSLGVDLVKKDLEKEGVNVQFIIEDGQLDPKVALNAAQKLVNVDHVSAIYSEFNPAAIAVSSFLKGKNVLHIYDAAPVSPLAENPNVFKSYLDFEKSCEKVAQVVKNLGVERVGLLKANLEFGDLCLTGIKNIFGDNVFVRNYNVGETDFRTSLTKLKSDNIQALFNPSFQAEALASLKQMDELKLKAIFVSVSEIITSDIKDQYSNILEGSIMFGLPAVSQEFISRVNQEFPGKTYQITPLALAYVHVEQIANALNKCNKEVSCAAEKLGKAKSEPIIGFIGFNNRIAGFDIVIQEWRNGKLQDIPK